MCWKGVDMDTYRKLLTKVNSNILNPTTLSYVSTSEYNIFSLLGVAAKEVIMCRFLADLLNPEGMHGCEIVFLKSFLENVLEEDRTNDTLLTCTDIITEFGIDNERRIDIVIRNARFFIPIEVKIYADDSQ